MQTSNIKTAEDLIQTNLYLSLATTFEGEPWVATVFYAVDNHYNFYFLSAKDSRHALHIHQNPKVAFTIYNSQELPENANGVQVEGLAEIIENPVDISRVITIYYLKRFPNETVRAEHPHTPQDFRDDSLRRFFQITPTKFYTLDPDSTKIDRRIEIKLKS